jgi:SNF2 family DNA or RNA helicase
MAAMISVGLANDGTSVRIARQKTLSNEDWLQVRAIWGSDGRAASQHIDLPLEQFMSRRQVFARRCQELGATIELDDAMRGMGQLARQTKQQLDRGLSEQDRISPSEIAEALAQSRFRRELRDFQENDLGRLMALPHGANFSVPGAGKTTVAYALYESERMQSRVDRLLVIAPLSAFESWRDEAVVSFEPVPRIYEYAGGRIPAEAEVVLVNYQRLAPSYEHLSRWVQSHATMVLLDEAHRMKRGWNGEWGTACLNLAYLARRRDILTGTPAPQGPGDLVALIDFLWPNEARRILPADALSANPPADAGYRVAKAIGPLFVRTNKKTLDLPPVTILPVTVGLAPLHREIYDALRDNYAGQLAVSKRDRLDLLVMGRITMYMLEAATNPKLLSAGSQDGADADVFRHPPLAVEPGSRLAELIESYNLYETPSKFIELGRLIRANADVGRKTLVWSNFVRNLRLLEEMLRGYEPALIHGAVPPRSSNPTDRTRETEIRRFREDDRCQVLLANPAAMSEGISLHHDCHDAIYLERTFNAGQYLQSLDRIHRLGLAKNQGTRVTFLLSEGTVDETVDRRVRIKAERLGEMLNDPTLPAMALPNDDDYGLPIDSVDDVEALFAHLRGDDVQ